MNFEVTLLDWLPALASGLLVLSFALRDIKWLRLLVLAASVVDITVYYATHHGQPMLIPIGKQVVLIGINLYQLYSLYREARPIRFSEEADLLYRRAFADLAPGEFNRLLQSGSFESLPAGAQLTRKDQPLDAVYVFLSGELDVKLGETVLTRLLKPGTFVGDMGYITQTAASVDVLACRESRVFRMPIDALEELHRVKPELHIKLTGILSGGIAEKLRLADARLLARLHERPATA
jgi:hypothetical protein